MRGMHNAYYVWSPRHSLIIVHQLKGAQYANVAPVRIELPAFQVAEVLMNAQAICMPPSHRL